jgi:hypothetical protein
MALVVAVVALVIANYHQVVARFPEGGGAAAAAGSAFGEDGHTTLRTGPSWCSW